MGKGVEGKQRTQAEIYDAVVGALHDVDVGTALAVLECVKLLIVAGVEAGELAGLPAPLVVRRR